MSLWKSNCDPLISECFQVGGAVMFEIDLKPLRRRLVAWSHRRRLGVRCIVERAEQDSLRRVEASANMNLIDEGEARIFNIYLRRHIHDSNEDASITMNTIRSSFFAHANVRNPCRRPTSLKRSLSGHKAAQMTGGRSTQTRNISRSRSGKSLRESFHLVPL
jgi:hypothetical protein